MFRRARALAALDDDLHAVLFFSLAGLDLSLWSVGNGLFLGFSNALVFLN